MAHQLMYQFRYCPVPMVTELFAKVTIGAAGAPTLVPTSSLGVVSISRSSAGVYVVTLNQKYNRLMMADARFIASAGPASPIFNVKVDNVAASGALTLLFQSAIGTAADPASGEIMLLQIVVKNSTVLG